jgi:hypothetical protein
MNDVRRISMNADEVRELMRETVRETLTGLGVKVDDPIEVQKDFQHLREWRETTESIKSKGILAMAGIVASGLVAAAWLGIKQMLGPGH